MTFFRFNKGQIYQFIDKYFLYLSLATVVIIVGVGFTALVNPAFKQVRQTDVLKADQKQKEFEDAQKFLSELKKLRDKYATVDFNDIGRLNTILPKGFDSQRIYQQMQQLVKNAGFDLTSISFSNSVSITVSPTSTSSHTAAGSGSTTTAANSEPQIQKVTVIIGVANIDSYTKLKTFVALVDHQAPILDLSSLSLPLQSKATFTLSTYFFQE